MKKKRVLIGSRYGTLTVISDAPKDKSKHFMSLVKCDCGTEFVLRDCLLLNGVATRCRHCASNSQITHGMTNTRMFKTWQRMKSRCYNPNDTSYKNYGKRGIKVCDKWNEAFENFRDWAFANGYSDNLSIDRIDVNGNYEPSNCRWATVKEQARNKRNSVILDYGGKPTHINEIAEKTGINSKTIYTRIHNGWTEYDATHDKKNHTGDAFRKYRCYRRKEVDLIDKNGEITHFVSMRDASRYLGYGDGFLSLKSMRANKNVLWVDGYEIRISDAYTTENVYEEYIAGK